MPMPTLSSRITDLAARTAAQCKAINMLINGNGVDLTALTTTAKTSLVASINELKASVDQIATTPGLIDDASTGTGRTWSASFIQAKINAAVSALVNGAPTTLDTLKELSDAITADHNGLQAILTQLGTTIRFDQAQTLTAAQALQARSNIGAAAASDVGDTTTDFVAVFNAGLA